MTAIASNDVKFNLPANTMKIPDPKEKEKETPKEKKHNKWEGINKEFFNRIGGIPPQMIINPAKGKDKAGVIKPENKWVCLEFEHPARNDHLKLRHWVKESEKEQPYVYGKLSRKIDLIKYSAEEYEEFLKDLDPTWSKDETDVLWELCELYDLRFIVIADRFANCPEYKRSIEELKDRYFSIAKKLLEQRGETSHLFVKKPFNFEYEVKRKSNLEKLLLQTAEQYQGEKQYLEMVKVLEQKIKKEEKEMKNLKKLMSKEDQGGDLETDTFSNYRRPPHTLKPAIPGKQQPVSGGESSPCMSPSGRGGRRDRGSGVYLRSQLMNASLPIPEKAKKKLDQVLKELGIPEKLTPTAAVVKVYDSLRKEALTYLSFEKHVQKKEKEKKLLEARLDEIQKSKKSFPPQIPGGSNPQMLPPQNMGQMMVPGPNSGMNNPQMQPMGGAPSHMITSTAVPFPQGMPSHMQQIPQRGHAIPNMNHGHGHTSQMPVPMQMQMQQQMHMNGQVPPAQQIPHRHTRQNFDTDITGEGSTIGAQIPGYQRQPHPVNHEPPPAPAPAPEREVTETQKTQDPPESAQNKKKGKRKPKADKKTNKRASAEGSGPDSEASEKKKKKK